MYVYVLLDQSCNAITEEYTDHGFSITWNETLVGVTVEAACTGTGLNGKMNNNAYVTTGSYVRSSRLTLHTYGSIIFGTVGVQNIKHM